jgi:hypothetical protein
LNHSDTVVHVLLAGEIKSMQRNSAKHFPPMFFEKIGESARCFSLLTERRTFHLEVDDETQYNVWTAAIQSIINTLNDIPPPPPPQT